MSDERSPDDGFLGRWAKRKAQARAREDARADSLDRSQAESPGPDAAPQPENPDEPPFDLSQLPSLDEITAETNLVGFMRKEVPAVLRNAALRRAWALDPAIRDYVNPAREYAYDWNTPGGVPGNGPIEAGFDALKHVAEAFQPRKAGHTSEGDEASAASAATMPDGSGEADAPSSVRMPDVKSSRQDHDRTFKSRVEGNQTAEPATPVSQPALQRRRHGGAAPV